MDAEAAAVADPRHQIDDEEPPRRDQEPEDPDPAEIRAAVARRSLAGRRDADPLGRRRSPARGPRWRAGSRSEGLRRGLRRLRRGWEERPGGKEGVREWKKP